MPRDVVACKLLHLFFPFAQASLLYPSRNTNLQFLQGTKDVVYSVANAEREIKLFVNSPDARLVTVPGGAHFLSASHPKDVDQALIEFVKKYSA